MSYERDAQRCVGSVFVDEFQRKWRTNRVQKKFFRTKLSILDYPLDNLKNLCIFAPQNRILWTHFSPSDTIRLPTSAIERLKPRNSAACSPMATTWRWFRHAAWAKQDCWTIALDKYVAFAERHFRQADYQVGIYQTLQAFICKQRAKSRRDAGSSTHHHTRQRGVWNLRQILCPMACNHGKMADGYFLFSKFASIILHLIYVKCRVCMQKIGHKFCFLHKVHYLCTIIRETINQNIINNNNWSIWH